MKSCILIRLIIIKTSRMFNKFIYIFKCIFTFQLDLTHELLKCYILISVYMVSILYINMK